MITFGNYGSIGLTIRIIFSQIGLFGFFWLTCYGIAPESSSPWNGLVFGFLAIFLTAYIAGQLCSLVRVPPLVGMLIAGICLSNLTSITLDPLVSSFARNLALAVILLRAGVSLDPLALRKLSLVCLRLAFTPCIVEALILAVGTYLLLHLPFLWCMVLGFVCVATSPAVIVPSMISIQDEGYGTDKGIPTLIMGGSSVDDVMAITGFEIFLSLVTSSSSSILSTLAGPAEAIGGLILGTGLGLLFWILPPSISNPDDIENKSFYGRIRFFFLLLTGISFIFTTKVLGCESMGPLGTLSMAFVAALRWRSEGYIDDITINLRDIWFFAEIFLFSLIGYEVKFSSLQSNTVLWSLVCLFIGMISRTIVSFGVVLGAGLTIKERFFIAMAWLPKGTVQAAIGSIPLELARAKQDETQIQYGLTILTFAVLSIIISAPLGAYLISFFGPKLLVKSSNDQQFRIDVIECLSI
ncbi:sodium/hydrogen exchanger 9B2-like [Panonychus citri]|uniref:sodium/hydrogen exchanger 9B2-like n=1 Tax=Panonychus citri TaxID=50023 RepID=UPI0023080FB1|nr:sodium/hydrogen exchanger 9B2-like [Panonychus citri]